MDFVQSLRVSMLYEAMEKEMLQASKLAEERWRKRKKEERKKERKREKEKRKSE